MDKKYSIHNHIAIEGIDGCGKSTFLAKLKEDSRFSNKKEDGEGGHSPADWNGISSVSFDRSPYDEEACKYIRSLLKSNDGREYLDTDTRARVLLKAFMSDNMIHANDIKELYDYPGCTNFLFTDRYIASTLAYQSLNNPEDIVRKEFENSNVEVPGLILYFDVDPRVTLERINKRGEDKELFENLKMLNEIKENYKKVFNYLNNYNTRIVFINASLSADEVYNNATEAIFDYINGNLNYYPNSSYALYKGIELKEEGF